MTNKQTFDFLKDHSPKYLEMALDGSKRERLAQPDGYGRRTGDCKDTVEIFLMVQDNRIHLAAFETDGCIDTHACANSVVHLVEGKSLEQAWQITPETVEQFLESLRENHKHCAQLAVGALYLALSNALEVARRPWKKLYRQH